MGSAWPDPTLAPGVIRRLAAVKQRILELIDTQGPLPFDQYMALCLYDPDIGYFTKGAVRPGMGSDFVTSPEVSPWFGKLLGRWARSLAAGSDAVLVEIGSGSGALLAPLAEEVGDSFTSLYAVEVSASAQRETAARVPHAITVGDLADIPFDGHAIVVVNEVLDNLPARLVERIDGRWMEHCVVGRGDDLLLETFPADDELGGWCDQRLANAPDGVLLTAQVAVEGWIADLSEHFDRVDACIIDYGGDTATLAGRRRGEVVRTYRRQRAGFDALAEPGATDITVDVNSDVVRGVVEELGGTVTTTDQASFLDSLGAGGAIRERIDRSHALARSGDVMGQLEARSEATDITALVEPSGFGGFSVFLISKGT